MSDILNLEDNANTLLKKLTILLDNLSHNLSKEKTEKALCEGYDCIKEIENIIEEINKKQGINSPKNNIFTIKGDLKQKKEKLEKIQNTYISNKSNELIDSFCSTNIQEEKNNNDVFAGNNDLSEGDCSTPEQNIQKEEYNDEIFQVNKDITELSEEYINNDNCLFIVKRRIIKFFRKICNKIKETTSKTKYLIILIILFILLILSIIGIISLFLSDSNQY